MMLAGRGGRALGGVHLVFRPSTESCARGRRGAHLKHLARTCDARHVETQRLVER